MKTFLVLFVFIVLNISDSRRLDKEKFRSCHIKCPQSSYEFNCDCESDEWHALEDPRKGSFNCIPSTWLCDGWKDCKDGSDEIECSCPQNQTQCSFCNRGGSCYLGGRTDFNLYQCIDIYANETPEYFYLSINPDASKSSLCLSETNGPKSYKSDCLNFQYIGYCDGYVDCPVESSLDERNCSGCTGFDNISCECNKQDYTCQNVYGQVCYYLAARCDNSYFCIDGSDEWNCPCKTNEFKCLCYNNIPVTCPKQSHGITGCIDNTKYHDGKQDCPDGSDETQFVNIVECDQCNMTLRRLSNMSQCHEIGFPFCDNSTCFEVPSLNSLDLFNCSNTDIICTSYCTNNSVDECKPVFQCNDGSLILSYQFCDGKTDCADLSDEIRTGPGFKCLESLGTCVLPQRNLYDNVAQCKDKSDLQNKINHFQCFDNRLLISSKQICNGVVDCYDFSDECLCEININNLVCNDLFSSCESCITECNNSNLINVTNFNFTILGNTKETIVCENKWGTTTAILCDERPECRDFSDECNCEYIPEFCNDSCHDFYPLGDRYCDGVIDEAWKYIKKSECLEGFDEVFCPKRFRCNAGNRISIDIEQKCNGVRDCYNGEDEVDCSHIGSDIFSSNTEMISSVLLKSLFWIMGFAVVTGNAIVILTTIHFLISTKKDENAKCQHYIILNISIADFIMGLYLITIAIYSVIYSGNYGKLDLEWRSSLRCSIIGSLTILSSEASCFSMVLLMSFRLYVICNPFSSQTSSTVIWKFFLLVVWLVSGILAFIPLLPATSDYFVGTVGFSNLFTATTTWDRFNVTKFTCRLSLLSNKSVTRKGSSWNSVLAFLQNNFPQYFPIGEFGYYGETSVCMPRFYLPRGDTASGYSIGIISVNFISFVFIALGYVLMYIHSTKQMKQFQNKQTAKKEAIMQKRIARLILTDFLCWIPICIMAFVRYSGIYFDNIAYIVSATLLLPINSAFNPLLYSSLPDKLFQLFCKGKSNINQNAEYATLSTRTNQSTSI